MATFTNWSGSVTFAPAAIEEPKSEPELVEVVQRAAEQGQCVRPVGQGHSFSPLVHTEDILVDLRNLRGLVTHGNGQATLWAGTTIRELGEELHRVGLAIENIGDVDFQTVAGGFGTATHGSGVRFGHLATQLVGARLVTAAGELVEWHQDRQPELLRGLRCALGSLGIITQVRVRVVPTYELHRLAWCTRLEHVLAHLPELIESNRVFDFYWYPRSDLAQIRTLNLPGQEPALHVPVNYLHEEQRGPAYEVLPKDQSLRYEEMEYLLPAAAGPDCLREVRQRIRQKHRRYVGWRVLYRTIAADDAYLSPAYGRDSVSIAILQNHRLPWQEYFDDVEVIFREYGGRPHWGKRHSLTHSQLRPLYPAWDTFQRLRREQDPDGRFLNDHLRELFGTPPRPRQEP